jgi:PAS domain S-box-containing protein
MSNIEKSKEELLQELKELKQENESLKISFQKDIDERNNAEEKHRVSEEFSQYLLQTIPFGIDITDKNGYILFQNDVLRNQFVGESIGKKCWEVYNYVKTQCSECPLAEPIKIGITERRELINDFIDKKYEIIYTGILFKGNPAILKMFIDITERKRGEELLLKNEQLFRTLYDDTPLMNFTITSDGIIISVNRFGSEYLGYTSSELTNKSVLMLFPENEKENAIQQVAKCCANPGKLFQWEIQKVRKDGSSLTVKETAWAVQHLNKPLEVVIICEDISERKLTDDKLKASEEYFKAIFENSSTAMVVIEPDMTISMINNELTNISGYTKEYLIGKKWEHLIASTELERLKEFNKRRLIDPNSAPDKYETTMINQFGELRDELLSISVLRNNKMIVSILDITNRKRAEKEIVKLSRAIEQSPVSIVITDKNGIIEYLNPKAYELTGYTKEEAIGKNPRIFRSGKIHIDYFKQLWDTILSGNEWRGELLNKKKNGELYWESVSISPIINSKGEITHFIGVKENITDRKRADEEINKLYDELKISNKIIQDSLNEKNILVEELTASEEKLKETVAVKDKFFSIIAHDLRGPFSGFLGLTDLMAKEADDLSVKEIKTMSEAINKSANSVYKLIDDLLQWSRTQTGAMPFLIETLDLFEIAFNTTFSLMQMASNKKIKLIQNIKPDNIVSADRNMITTVFRNLVSNSIKFTEENGEIEIGLQEIKPAESTLP